MVQGKHIVILGLALLLAVGVSAQMDADEIVQKVRQKVDTDKPMRVKFQQVFEWKLTGKVEKMAGEMVLEGLNKFRIVTPDQTVVSNGKIMWTYSRLENQVIIDQVRHNAQTLMPRDILLSYPDQYNIRVWKPDLTVQNEPAVALLMQPKSSDQFLQELKVWISKESWHPLKVEFTDLNDNSTTYQINSVTIDTTISEEQFTFHPDSTTDIIDVR